MNLKHILTIVLITLCLSYVAFFWMPLNTFFVGDEGVKYLQIESLSSKGLSGIALPYPAENIDVDYEFYPIIPPYSIVKGGQAFSQWPLLYPAIVALFYRWLGFYGLYVLSILSAVASLVALVYIRCRLGFKVNPLSLILIIMSTPLLVYSVLLWEHAFSLALILAALAFWLAGINKRSAALMLTSGACLGFAVWTRNESILLVPAMAFAWFRYKAADRSTKAIGSWLTGMAVVLTGMLIVQKFTVGESLGLDVSQFVKEGVSTEISAFTKSIASLILYKVKLSLVLTLYRFENEAWILSGLAWIVFAIGLWRDQRWWAWPAVAVSSVMIIGVSIWALAAQPMQAGFLLNPVIVIFGLVAYKNEREHKEDIRFLADTAVVFAVLTILLAPATGGVQWGIRFLLPATVIMAFLAICLIGERGGLKISWPVQNFLRSSFAVAMIFSIIWQVSGLVLVRNDRQANAELLLTVAGGSEQAIVTDTFWLPQELAAIFTLRNIFYVDSNESYDDLIKLMALNGLDNYSFITSNQNNPLKGNRNLFDILITKVVEEKTLPAGFYMQSITIVKQGET